MNHEDEFIAKIKKNKSINNHRKHLSQSKIKEDKPLPKRELPGPGYYDISNVDIKSKQKPEFLQ